MKIPKYRYIFLILLLMGLYSSSLFAQESDLKDIKLRAEKGEMQAQTQLGLLYANGEQVEQSFSDAKLWWEKAAEQGAAAAQFYLGKIYASGAGVEKDQLEAKKWWELSAAQDNVPSLFNLAMLYVNGEAVTGSYVEAGKYFEKAARLGNVQSQFNFGVLNAQGLGFPQSDENGYAWIKLAADKGHPNAMEFAQDLEGKMSPEQLVSARAKSDELRAVIPQ